MMFVPTRLFAAVCLFIASFALVSAQSSTFTVNTDIDSVDANPGDGVCADSNGLCSLRAAIMEANADSNHTKVNLPAGDYITTLASGPSDESFGDLDITQSIEITGAGADVTFISNGVSGERVMELSQGANVAWGRIENLTLRNGDSSSEGGGLYIASEAIVYLLNIEVADNRASNGGGIWVESMTKSLVLADSSIISNTATGSCGGLYVGSTDNDVIQNITFYGNTALTGAGGAVCFSQYASQPDHILPVLNYVTITQNSAGTSGGAIMSYNADRIWLANSIVVENSAGTSGANCAHGTPAQPVIFNDTGSIFDLQGCSGSGETDLVTGAPVLGTLAPYTPGHTRMVNLIYGSPALDYISDPEYCNYEAKHDQRGIARPQGPSCDAGAYEMEQGPAQTYTVNSEADTVDVVLGDAICADASGNCSLRAALMQANAFGNTDTIIVPAGDYISSLTSGPTDDSYGDFDILQPVSIQGVNADETIISSGVAGERVLEIAVNRQLNPDQWDSTGSVQIERASFTDGNTAENGGGILIDSNVMIFMVDTEVANNTAANGGGIWIERAHTFWTERSTIAENTAANSCGGIYAGKLSWSLNVLINTIARNQAVAGEGGGMCFSEFLPEQPDEWMITGVLAGLSIVDNHAGTLGGGVINRSTAKMHLAVSLLVGNTAGVSGHNCAFAGAATETFYQYGYNLFDANGCTRVHEDDIVTDTPNLGPLALHAPGHTRTVSLLPNSPAVDIGDLAFTSGIDQRGVRRPSGYGLDTGAYELVQPGVWVQVPDMPPMPELFPLKVSESGLATQFQLYLGSEPQGTVVYTFSDAGGDLSFDPHQIVFTADDWDDWEAGIVTVSAADDAIVEGLENTEIIVTVGGTAPEYAGVVPLDPITVEITDNDSYQITVEPSMTPPLAVSEDGTTASFDVSINSEPTGSVIVTFGSAGSDFALDIPSVEFDATNWQTPVTVTVSTADDGVAEGTTNGAITFTVGGAAVEYAGMTVADMAVTVLDDDNVAINVTTSTSPLTISEDGTTANFDVSINSEPTGSVIVTFGGAGSDFALGVPSVEFNAANWQTPVTVTVSAIDDGVAEGTTNGAITFTVGGTAVEYAGMTVADMAVTVLDDDNVAINVITSTSPLAISEDGTSATFDILLDSEPTGSVIVTFGGAGSDFALGVPSVEFNAANWQTPVTVTVSAVDDDEAEGTENTAVVFTVGGTSAEYTGVTHANLPVRIADNDILIVAEDLITNGGWETGGVTAWKYTSARAKRQCKGNGNGSNCALLLKPGIPLAVAYQNVPAALVPFAAGETLYFEFAAKVGGTAKLNAILKLKYLDGTRAKLKVRPMPVNTAKSWVVFSLEDSSAALLNLKAIRVQFKHNGGTGKIRVDDVVLQRLSHVMLPRGEFNPLPVPPPDFRGGN